MRATNIQIFGYFFRKRSAELTAFVTGLSNFHYHLEIRRKKSNFLNFQMAEGDMFLNASIIGLAIVTIQRVNLYGNYAHSQGDRFSSARVSASIAERSSGCSTASPSKL